MNSSIKMDEFSELLF